MDVVPEGVRPQSPKPAIPAIEPRPARQAASFMGLYSDAETQRYMRELFQADFNSLDMLQNAKIKSGFQQQVDRLIQRTVAEEFQRPAQYTRQSSQGTETMDAEPVLMLRRAAFVSRMNEKAGYNRETGTFARDPAFIFLDLKDIYAANMAGSADWLLSSVAQQLNIIARSYFEGIGRPGDYATCRYGGDEFVMGTVGLTPEQNIELQKRIRLAISQMTAFYMRPGTGKISERAVGINTEKDNLITLPQDQVDKKIFITYLNRGLILDSEELAKIRTAFTKNGIFDRSKFQDVTTAPNKDKSYEERLYKLFFSDPDLAMTLTFADYIDREEEKQARNKGINIQGKRKSNLVRLLDAVVLDPLLGENVLSFEGMKDQIARGEVSEMVCIDLKYIKEINDRGSMAEGDMAIAQLWRLLESSYRGAEKSDFVFARRGGTFLIALRKKATHPLSKDIIHSIPTPVLDFRGQTASAPLGFASVSLEEGPNGMDAYRWSGKVIGDVISRAELNWYEKIAEQIRSHPDIFNIFQDVRDQIAGGVDLETAIANTKSQIHDEKFSELSHKLVLQYFFGKEGLRTSQRQAKIQSALFPPAEETALK